MDSRRRRALERLVTVALLAAPALSATPPRCQTIPVEPEPTCPTAVIGVEEGEEVLTQTVLHLSGDQSYAADGRQIVAWRWSVDQPFGSASVFVPSEMFRNPTFEANVAGVYTFHLDVWDDAGEQSCAPAEFEVFSLGEGALHIELLWTTPGDPDETDTGPFAGADVDLHFIHPAAPSSADAPDVDGDGAPDPWFDEPYDCFWYNPHPDWGEFGNERDDDPGLDRDDTDGAGPENINLRRFEPGAVYGIGVHYWNDHAYGVSFATVRVYLYGRFIYEVADQRLVNYDLWCVAWFDADAGTVEPCLDEAGEPRISPNYQHPLFFGRK